MLKFDAETSRILEIAYQGADITRRRQASFDVLQPGPGDRVADIGCGNGLLTSELARAVGDGGVVFGIDPSDDMRNLAIERCADFACVQIIDGTAHDLPLPDKFLDGAVSVQVLNYLDDLPAVAAESGRVLKPGGRLVVGDNHWDTLAWFSDDPVRMTKMAKVWDHHLKERCVPAVLPALLQDAGFVVDGVHPLTCCDTVLRPDGLAQMLLLLIENYAVQNDLANREEARLWAEEQRSLAAAGRFFFSLTHFVVSARKA